MADNVGSKVTYFLVGLGVGALVGILFAPKTGEETRDFLSKKADEGKDYAQRKARELRERADELIERGKEVAVRKKDSISAAVEAGRGSRTRSVSARIEGLRARQGCKTGTGFRLRVRRLGRVCNSGSKCSASSRRLPWLFRS